MWIGIVTLFPEMFRAISDFGMPSRAIASGNLVLELANPREFACDRHRTVDDAPYGGGPGLVMKAEPTALAIESLTRRASEPPCRIYLSPEGRRFDHEVVAELLGHDSLVLIAGHYEGLDERLRRHMCDDEISVGDYVLSGGELPSMVLVDALARNLPGVLGNPDSLQCESFVGGRLEGAQYTRPKTWRGDAVPAPLLSGDHRIVTDWRKRSALERTYARRPDLLIRQQLDSDEVRLIQEFCGEQEHA